MSYDPGYDPNYDPNGDPWGGFSGNTGGSGQSENDFINMLFGAGAGGAQMPGKTAAQRLAYLKSFESLLGVPMTALAGQAGQGSSVAPPPFVSQQRAIYGDNPMYKNVFDAIDNHVDPDTALKMAGVKPVADDPNSAVVRQAAVDYATEKVRYNQDLQKQQTATFTKPDGSKYKNAPLGGTDIFGTASEFDLMGAPTEQTLVDQYVKSLGTKRQTGTKTTMNVGPHGPAVGTPSKAQRSLATRVANHRITQAKGTQVRSDANANLMRRILAAKTLLGL